MVESFVFLPHNIPFCFNLQFQDFQDHQMLGSFTKSTTFHIFLSYNSFYAVSNILMVVDRLVKKSRTQDKMVMKLERSNKAKDIENER